MLSKYEMPLPILPSRCDSTGRLSFPQVFSAFGDIANVHADHLNIGMDVLGPKDLFWVAVRTTVRVHRLPPMGMNCSLVTWPETPERVRTYRDYQLLDPASGEVLAEGRTEWGLLNTATGRPAPLAGVFPEDFEFLPQQANVSPFTRIKDDMGELEPFASYTVRSTDIDVGGHFNNAHYLRALASVFSNAEWQAMDLGEIEVNYKNQSYEGETLQLRRREENGAIRICMSNAEGKVVLQVILRSCQSLSEG